MRPTRLALTLTGLLLLGQNCALFTEPTARPTPPPAAVSGSTAPGGAAPTQTAQPDQSPEPSPATTAPEPSSEQPADQPISEQATTFSGAVLAGSHAPLLDFTQADYEAALASGDLVVLYFYANWCPICEAELPHLYAAFNELTTTEVVGFRVNFNDNQTEAAEVEVAREHGVPYQHTKVFVRNGQRLLKSPESWEQQRYHDEIMNALGQ